ncbi:MAG: FliI/YscN family ATPase, partial [Actinomycetota bacterium]|nr:FliI/YscN family ATPase [Actinomycetota bacterium]
GREVRDFIERDLGEEGLSRSVVVVATSDQPALIRLKGAFVATAIAEYFRDQGKDVMLMMDSVTRFAMAQREVGLAIGEPPATRGYTPSVFALLPKLLERSGTAKIGTITGLYTVLVEADDMNEPIADTVRSILDGHIVLSRKLASQNHYPAIDILQSVSRVMPDIVTEEHMQAASQIRDILSTYQEAEDLINIGAYVSGSNPRIDYAVELIDQVNAFLKQNVNEKAEFYITVRNLMDVLETRD